MDRPKNFNNAPCAKKKESENKKESEKEMRSNPIILVDFDGVIHSYASGWKGAAVIADPPVPGAIEFLIAHLPTPEPICAMAAPYKGPEVQIYSSRSGQAGGIKAMQEWLVKHGLDRSYITEGILKFPTQKNAAFLTIDDRAICFAGKWPTTAEMLAFKPWHKRVSMTQFTERAENEGYELIMASPFEVGLVKNGQGIRTWWLTDFDGQMPKLDHPLVLLAISIEECMDGVVKNIEDGIIEMGTARAVMFGLTHDDFLEGTYLWKTRGAVYISFIAGTNRKGAFRELVQRILAMGLSVKVPTPLGRMEQIVRKCGYKHTTEKFMDEDCDVWVLTPEAGRECEWTKTDQK